MSTNILGIRNNNTIIPLTASTKRTKQMDFSAAGLITGTNWTTTRATAIAYADSNSVWRLRFNIMGTIASSYPTTFTGTFASTAAVVFKNGNSQALAATFADSSAVTKPCMGAAAISNSGSFTIDSDADGMLYVLVSGDVELNAKPVWADANMEGVVAVDVFVPEATATVAGIVGTGAQTIAGVKTFKDGVALAATKGIDFSANTQSAVAGTALSSETLDWYEQGTWTPTRSAGITVVGSFSSSGGYVRIGKLVTITGSMAGSTSVAGGATSSITGLPFNAAGDFGTGVVTSNNAEVAGFLWVYGGAIYFSGFSAFASVYFTASFIVA